MHNNACKYTSWIHTVRREVLAMLKRSKRGPVIWFNSQKDNHSSSVQTLNCILLGRADQFSGAPAGCRAQEYTRHLQTHWAYWSRQVSMFYLCCYRCYRSWEDNGGLPLSLVPLEFALSKNIYQFTEVCLDFSIRGKGMGNLILNFFFWSSLCTIKYYKDGTKEQTSSSERKPASKPKKKSYWL